jgi:two-component system, cell cycle response regulator
LPGSVRNYDYAGRYGGDEFLIVLTHCTPPNLIVTAERIRFHVSEKPVAVDSELIDVTTSIAMSAQRSPATELPREEDPVRGACAALYSAKANGRNRIEEAPDIGSGSSARAAAVPKLLGRLGG